MKRLQYGARISLALCLALLMLVSVSCKQNKIVPAENALADMERFLTVYDVDYEITGKQPFDDWLSGFRYENGKLKDYAETHSSNSETKWSYGGYSDAFDFMNLILTDGTAVTESASLKLYRLLDGMTIPCGVTYEDSFDEAAIRFGFGEDLRKRFSADEGSKTDMTLKSDGSKKVVYRNLIKSDDKEEKESSAPLQIVYVEEGTYEKKDGTTGYYVRTLTFAFRYENSFPLDYVELAVTHHK